MALANLDYFEKYRVLDSLTPKIRVLENCLKSFETIPEVGDVRQVGMMAGIELVQDRETKKPFSPQEKIGMRVIGRAREKGAILRPLGSVIVLMPPLAMSEEELSRLLDITFESIQEVVSH